MNKRRSSREKKKEEEIDVETKGPRNGYAWTKNRRCHLPRPYCMRACIFHSSAQLLLDLIPSHCKLHACISISSIGRPAGRSRVLFIPVVLPTVRPCTAAGAGAGRRRRGRGRRRGRRRAAGGGRRRRRAGLGDELPRREVQYLRRRTPGRRRREREGQVAAPPAHHHELLLDRRRVVAAAPAALQQLRVLHEVRVRVRVRHDGRAAVLQVRLRLRLRHCCQVHRRRPRVPVVVRDAAGDDEAEVGSALHALREVELGLGALEPQRRLVVGDGGVLRRVEGAEPHPRRLLGVPDLRRPLAPRPLPHPSVVPPQTCTSRGAKHA
uniref:Uncharacterized protein n=1 Tax=Zea mays TaxID=4577 RepID=A0A804MGZ9_MAIZE